MRQSENILILTTKYFRIRIIFTEKSSNLKILPFSTCFLCPKHPIRNKYALEQTQQKPQSKSVSNAPLIRASNCCIQKTADNESLTEFPQLLFLLPFFPPWEKTWQSDWIYGKCLDYRHSNCSGKYWAAGLPVSAGDEDWRTSNNPAQLTKQKSFTWQLPTFNTAFGRYVSLFSFDTSRKDLHNV